MVNATLQKVEKMVWICGECILDYDTEDEANECCKDEVNK